MITHYWVSGFGWENTIFQKEDFKTFEKIGYNESDGEIFLGITENNKKHILRNEK